MITPRSIAWFSVAAILGCAAEDERFSDEYNLVDLTHALSADMPFWPGPDANPFVHDTLRANADGSPAMAAYSTPEHHGTHIDAPSHGGAGLRSVDAIPVGEHVGPAVIIDVSAAATADADYAVSVGDIEAWELEHGPMPAGAIVLMRSGWDRYWTDPVAYFGRDADGRLHFPGFSAEAVTFLVNERNVVAVGVDTPSIDPGNARGFPAHGAGNGNGIYHLENVANLATLPAAGATILIAPVKIAGGSGGQVRVFGLLPVD